MEEAHITPATPSPFFPLAGPHKYIALLLVVLSWILVQRWSLRKQKGPRSWPVIGATVEQLRNYHRMHDWLVEYLSRHRTVTVDMPFTSYTYIADPVNVEHVLKTNFTNYPKVNDLNSLMFSLRKSELKAESNVPEHRVGNRVQILHGRAPR
jgi:long-chain fatty acid omega-monooxygenase